MFRGLAAKGNTNIKEADLFNPLKDAVAHLWILPTEEGSVMNFYITLGYIDTIADPMVDLIKKELAGATTIRRVVRQGQPNVEALHDQPFTKADPGASSGGVVGVGERINMFENTPFRPYTGPSHPSSPSYSRCECKECKDRQDKLFEKVEAISKAIEEFKSKRCVIPSKKHVDIILCIVRKRQLTYRKAYDAADRIMDLDFCKKLKDRYDQLNGKALSLCVGLDFLVPTLFLDEEEIIKYVRGDRPNPHDKSWTEAKRILAVISVNDMHYWAVEILLEEGKINVYDFNVPFVNDFDLFLLVEPLMVLLPILLRESKLMNHFPKEVLIKKLWYFEGRNKGMILPKDDAAKASGSHALALIECLLTDTEMSKITTFLYDNVVANLQEFWAYGVLTGCLKPVYIEDPAKLKVLISSHPLLYYMYM
ncbi:hypothetical protein P3S67_005725 [Capsicum chacoense]